MGLWLAWLVPHVTQFEKLLIVKNAKGLAVHDEKSRRDLLLIIGCIVDVIIKLISDLTHEHVFTVSIVSERLGLVVVLAPVCKQQVPTGGLIR